ncbi:MAG: trigger factor [Ruminococcaceae bacterium]|nr:trigger factor [Oscillospiraceae bacterium]
MEDVKVNVKNFERKENSKAEITVEFSAVEFEKALNDAYQKGKDMIQIPGFRKGKAPRVMVERMYGSKVFYEDALEELFPVGLDYAVAEQNITIVGQPAVVNFDVSDEKVAEITYSVALYPEAAMGEYKGVKAYKPAVEVTDEQVDAEVANIQQRNARIQPVEGRAAQDGDTANIDYEGFVDGVAFEGGKDEGYDLVLGSNTFIPGFEPQVVGMNIGDEKDITVTFPEEYHSTELAGKEAVFKIKLNEITERILPELDDEFAKDVSEFDTLAEYKESVKKELEEKAKTEVENAFREAVMEKVIAGMTVEVPDEMIDARVEDTIKNYESNFASQGIQLSQYLEWTGMTLDTFKVNIRPSVLQQIKTDLAFEKVAEIENFEIAEEEIAAEYSMIAEEYKMELEKVMEFIPRESVKTQIKIEKARNLIFDTAVAEEKAEEAAE